MKTDKRENLLYAICIVGLLIALTMVDGDSVMNIINNYGME